MNSDPSGSVAAPNPVQPDSVAPSRAVADSGRDRVLVSVRPFLYPALTVLATAIVLLGQLVEDATDSPPLQMFPNPPLLARWAVVALVLYSMIMSALLMQRAASSLSTVRPVVAIKQDAFDGYRNRLAHIPPRIEAGLFVGAAVVTAVLFLVLGSDLLLDDPVLKTSHKVPTDPLLALAILAAYTVVGWTFLRLMYIAGRSARI